MNVNVLIVDESPVFRETFSNLLNNDPDVDVIGIAIDTDTAKQKIVSLEPDVIVLNLNTAKQSNLTFLKEQLSKSSIPVVVITDSAAELFNTVRAGAVFVKMPLIRTQASMESFVQRLVEQIKAVAKTNTKAVRQPDTKPAANAKGFSTAKADVTEPASKENTAVITAKAAANEKPAVSTAEAPADKNKKPGFMSKLAEKAKSRAAEQAEKNAKAKAATVNEAAEAAAKVKAEVSAVQSTAAKAKAEAPTFQPAAEKAKTEVSAFQPAAAKAKTDIPAVQPAADTKSVSPAAVTKAPQPNNADAVARAKAAAEAVSKMKPETNAKAPAKGVSPAVSPTARVVVTTAAARQMIAGLATPKGRRHVIALGASTGGTDALQAVLQDLPVSTPGIVIVQHMPEVFTKLYADRLDRSCRMKCVEAVDGERVEPGKIILAAGNYHLRLAKDSRGYYVTSQHGEKVSGHCPSVDVLFDSVADVAGKDAIGAIFTGMGGDGARGLKKMRDAGAFTIGQDQNTCVVYGMPMVAFNMGAVCKQAPLDQIPAIILENC